MIQEKTKKPDSEKDKFPKMPTKSEINQSSYSKICDDPVNVMDIPPKVNIVWRNVLLYIYLHVAAGYGLFLFLGGQVMWKTVIWAILMYSIGNVGVTAGVHRLWSHKSYKAKLPLRIILVLMQTVACQNSIHEWTRDHRLHHKYSETNADPHNAKRGFFFAHAGWLLCRKHPAVKEKGKQIDMSDLEADFLIQFQKKHYLPLVLFCCFGLPTFIPWYFWSEGFAASWFFATQLRYCLSLHSTWLVNSAAHLWGDRPYDENINPAENKGVSIFAFGEGWHNYHHVFPWDYKAAELGHYKCNLTTAFIDFFAWIGWAYDLKTVSDKVVRDRSKRTGDGSRTRSGSLSENIVDFTMRRLSQSGPWGWGDKDIPAKDSKVTENLFPSFRNHD